MPRSKAQKNTLDCDCTHPVHEVPVVCRVIKYRHFLLMVIRAAILDTKCVHLPTSMALQVIRYMEDKLRQRDAMTEKLRLKNTTLKGQLQKV